MHKTSSWVKKIGPDYGKNHLRGLRDPPTPAGGPRIDFSTFRVDEQVPPLNSRLKINQRPIKEKPGFELPIVMDVKKQQGEAFIRIDDETEEV